MEQKHQRTLGFIKGVTIVGVLLGFMMVVGSFFVSGINHDYMLSIGIGVMVGFMFIFGTLIFLPLIEEFSYKSKQAR